jgi:hypothetical protein
MSLRQLSSPKVTMLLTEGSLDSGRLDCSNRHPEARHLGPRRLDARVSAAHLVLNHPGYLRLRLVRIGSELRLVKPHTPPPHPLPAGNGSPEKN